MEKVRISKFGVRSPPWCSGEKRGIYVKIIFNAQIIRDSICTQFWARVVEALARCQILVT